MWRLEYYRYGILQEYEDEELADVLRFGVVQSEEGNIAMYQLIDPNGQIHMNMDELQEYWFSYY